ncbi:MAG: SRPBCC family protein [Acidimicrobiales bacterium]
MARYSVEIETPMAVDEAFAYMADLRNFASWDVGVRSSRQVAGSEPGLDASYDVAVRVGPTELTLRYLTTSFDPPHALVAVAENRLLSSHDTIRVRPLNSGAVVSYDAVLTLKGMAHVADPLLGLSFNQIGTKATDGLVRALHGRRLDLAES